VFHLQGNGKKTEWENTHASLKWVSPQNFVKRRWKMVCYGRKVFTFPPWRNVCVPVSMEWLRAQLVRVANRQERDYLRSHGKLYSFADRNVDCFLSCFVTQTLHSVLFGVQSIMSRNFDGSRRYFVCAQNPIFVLSNYILSLFKLAHPRA